MHHDKCVWAVSTTLKGGAKKGLKTIYVESGDKCLNNVTFLFMFYTLRFLRVWISRISPSPRAVPRELTYYYLHD